MKKRNFRKEIKKSESKNLTKYVLFAVLGVLVVSSVFMTVETATSSVKVSDLREIGNELSLEKRNLESTLAKSLSMSDLEKKGSELGYVKPAGMVYISGNVEAVAKLP